jgi:uncharacterized membrane protein YkoI
VAVTGGGGPQAGPVVGDPLRYPVVTTPGSGASDAADDESLHPVTQPTADDAVLGATGAPDGAAAGGGTALDDGAAPPAATPATPATPAAPAATSAATQFITAEQVKQIALAQAPGATSISLEFDRHKNHAKYEGTMIHGWIVYEFEIDAVTGAILKWKADEID